MSSRPLSLSACLLMASAAHPLTTQDINQSQESPPASLALRLTTPPHWEKDCLAIAIDRTNTSSSSLFIPDMGLYISTSVNELSNESSNEGTQGWINVYGASDIVSWEAKELLPGATLHDQRCLYPQVAIVDMKRQSRRAIPLHGKLRIDAYYFLNEESWRLSKSEREAMLHAPAPSSSTKRHYASAVTQFASIPCREAGCSPVCNQPPPILHGESRVVPDVFYLKPEWGVRGQKISDELSRKFPDCSESSPSSR
jgi:hypothetical protein